MTPHALASDLRHARKGLEGTVRPGGTGSPVSRVDRFRGARGAKAAAVGKAPTKAVLVHAARSVFEPIVIDAAAHDVFATWKRAFSEMRLGVELSLVAATGMLTGVDTAQRKAFTAAAAAMIRRSSEPQGNALTAALLSAASAAPRLRLPTMGIDGGGVAYLTWASPLGRFEIFVDPEGKFEWYASFRDQEPLGSEEPVEQMPDNAWLHLRAFSRS